MALRLNDWLGIALRFKDSSSTVRELRPGPDNDEIPLRADVAATSEPLFALHRCFDFATLRLPPESTAVVEAMRPGASRLEPVPHCWQARPNVGVKRETAARRQARAVQDKPQQRAGLAACRWLSA